MPDGLDRLIGVIVAIRSDEKLTECFVRLLSTNRPTQQDRLMALYEELLAMKAPDEVMNFLRFLADPRIVDHILKALKKP